MKIIVKLRMFFRRALYRAKRHIEKIRTGRDRPRVVFIHIPKTGGTSIISYMKEYVGSKGSGQTVRYEDFLEQDIEVFAEKASHARFVMGHMPWTAFELCRDKDTFSFAVLRDPYDRLRSLYYYIVNLPASYERASEINDMQRMSLDEFLSSSDPRVRFYTDNYIARQFAGSLQDLADTEADRSGMAKTAIRNLSSIDVVGFNDTLNATLAEVAKAAGLPPPPNGRKVNVTSSLATSDKKKAEASRPFNDEMRELAAPLVEADMIVYQHFLKLREVSGVRWIAGSWPQHHPSHHGAVPQIVE